MSRRFRFYEKKRGHRRTGSKKVASAGEALFFGVFLGVGFVAFTAMFMKLVLPEWRANRHFAETTCTVLDKQLGKKAGDDGDTFRPEIHIQYEVDGEKLDDTTYDITEMYSSGREAVEAQLAAFEVGKQYPCWYDRNNPNQAVVVRGYSGWLYLLLLIPISFMVIGGGGLVFTMLHWDTSAERPDAIAKKRAEQDLFEAAAPTNHDFPTVPADDNLTNSPGVKLAYRLPIAVVPGWALFAALVACLLWNGLVAIFVVLAVQKHVAGEPDWMLTLLVLPFLLVGIALVAYLIRQLLITTGVGPTRIEIAEHPLNPGQQYAIFVSQAGRLTMNSLEVLLVCDEKATYKQGTDTRTEGLRVYEEQIFRREAFEIEHGVPFETECQVHVPTSAMHSFKSDHNEVNWHLVVRGTVEGWPDYERAFPVVVYPGDHEGPRR